jgi:tetratricopeptide (TPR) repeat protein
VELAEALIAARRFAEAVGVAEAAQAQAQNDPRFAVLVGRAWIGEGDLVRAQQELLKLAKARPQDAVPLRWLGEVLLKRGDPERAVKVLDKARALSPDDPELRKLWERAGRFARLAASAGEEPVAAARPKPPAPAPAAPPSPVRPAAPARPAAPVRPAAPARPAVPTRPAAPAAPPSPARPAPPARLAAPQPTPTAPAPRTPGVKLPPTPVRVAPPVSASATRTPVVPDFDFDEDEATKVADAGVTDFETDDSTVVASDLSAELAEATRGEATVPAIPTHVAGRPPARKAPAPPPVPPPAARPVPPPPPAPPKPAHGWVPAPHPPPPRAPGLPPVLESAAPAPSPAPPAPVPAPARVAPQVEQGLVDELAAAPAPPRRSRAGRAVLGLLLVAGVAAAGFYGYERWQQERRQDAAARIDQARALALQGDHPDLVQAELALRSALAADRNAPGALALLLAVQLQRVFEDGAPEPDALAATLSLAERAGMHGGRVDAARAALAAHEARSGRQAAESLAERSDDDPLVAYTTGRLLALDGDVEEAVRALGRAVAASPELHAARIALAEGHVAADRSDLAREELGAVLAASPAHLRAGLWAAVVASASGDPAAVLEALGGLEDRAAEAAPADRLLLELARATALSRQDALEDAVAAVHRASEAGVTAPRFLAMLAEGAAAVGLLDVAHDAAQQAVQGAPAHPAWSRLLARLRVLRGEGAAALEALEPLDRSEPDVLAVAVQAALLVGTEETLTDASKALEEHMEQEGDVAPALAALHLRVRLALGDGERLLTEARRLLRHAPDEPEAALAVAEVALASGRAPIALEALERALEARPEDAQVHHQLGRAHRLRGDGPAALQALERALELVPRHAAARRDMAQLLLELGQWERAAALFQEMMEGEGDAAAIEGRLGWAEALAAQGKTDEASRLLAEVPEEHRDGSAYRLTAARIAIAERKGGEGVKELASLAAGEEASAEIMVLFGDALYDVGDVNAAYKQYEKALTLDAGIPDAVVGQARVMVRASKPKKALDLLAEAERALEGRIRPPALRARLLAFRGQALLLRGDVAGAREALREATEIEGAPAEAHFFLGESLAGAHAPEARAAYESYLKLEPTGPYALRARRALN